MSDPKRIQLSRARGWRLPANTVKVDRTTEFGNPYRIGEPLDGKTARRWGWEISPAGRKLVCEDATEAVKRFKHALQWDEAVHDHVRERLKGKDLACWCALDAPCHADVLIWLANADPAEIRAINDAFDAELMAKCKWGLRGRRMKPPGKTTLTRMQQTAMLEAERIEITQGFWVKDGRISGPEPYQVERRDDFVGMVRLIDAINSDQDLLERLKRRMAALAAENVPAPVAPESEDGADDGNEASD